MPERIDLMLFDIVPDNFFSPLTARSKRAYWECICILFRVTSAELSFGIEREYLADELQYYFESNMSADISDDESWEQGDNRKDGPGADLGKGSVSKTPSTSNAASTSSTGSGKGANSASDSASATGAGNGNSIGSASGSSMLPREKANLMLRQLERWGWIYTETDMSYVQRTNFRDYAISVIRALNALDTADHPEYQGYIYTIYNLVKAGSEQAGIGLMQIVDNTEALIAGLKSLNANIKKYIDTLTRYSTVAEILDALLNDYYTNIIDKAYHRLMTSDNVAKFRPEIVQGLEAFSRNEKYLDKAAEQIAEIREISKEEARETALSMLHSVIDAFRRMDQIIEDINRKNMKYQRAAISRARFLLSSSDDIRGQLKEIIEYISTQMQELQIDHNTVYELEQLDGLIRLFTVYYLDTDSLYSPAAGRRSFEPEPLAVPEIDEAERSRKHLAMVEKLRNRITPDKIDTYVLGLLGDRTELKASELELKDIESFIKLVYVRLYGIRRNMSYETEPLQRAEVSGYGFRDFIIRRKVR